MCIVIDANVVARVFNQDNAEHQEFKPVKDWIYHGKGIVIYGGTKYIDEIGDNFQELLVQLRSAGKAIHVSDKHIDTATEEANKAIKHRDFDDAHLVGLLQISECKLIASLDARAFPFFQHPKFFTPAKNRPKIYRGKSNYQLLTEANFCKICLPAKKTTKKQLALIPD